MKTNFLNRLFAVTFIGFLGAVSASAQDFVGETLDALPRATLLTLQKDVPIPANRDFVWVLTNRPVDRSEISCGFQVQPSPVARELTRGELEVISASGRNPSVEASHVDLKVRGGHGDLREIRLRCKDARGGHGDFRVTIDAFKVAARGVISVRD